MYIWQWTKFIVLKMSFQDDHVESVSLQQITEVAILKDEL